VPGPGGDITYTLVVLLSLASKILGNDTHGNDTYGVLEEIIQATLMSAKTAKKRKKRNRRSKLLYSSLLRLLSLFFKLLLHPLIELRRLSVKCPL
jgi:hypothetical protein